jgi:electron transfer flavoprotein alpha subunit
VINIRPGAFKPAEGARGGQGRRRQVGEVGALTARRRYLETIAPEAGDVDITKEPVLVSIGRGIRRRTTSPSPRIWRKRWARR